jgi:hypothetical protein
LRALAIGTILLAAAGDATVISRTLVKFGVV